MRWSFRTRAKVDTTFNPEAPPTHDKPIDWWPTSNPNTDWVGLGLSIISWFVLVAAGFGVIVFILGMLL